MKVDTIKAGFTYLTAFTIVVGGFLLIYATRLDPSASTMQVLIGGFIGASIAFLFNSESSRAATYAAANSTAAGVASTPTVTTTAGPPQTTTVTPSQPTNGPTPIEADGLVISSESIE